MASTLVLIDWSRFANIKRKHPFTIEKPEIDAQRLKLIKNAIRRRKKREAILEKEFEEMKQKLALDSHVEDKKSLQTTNGGDDQPPNRNLGEKEQIQNQDKEQQLNELKELDEKMAALEMKIQTLNNEKHNLVSTLKNMLLEEKKREEEERMLQEQRFIEQYSMFDQIPLACSNNDNYPSYQQSSVPPPQGPPPRCQNISLVAKSSSSYPPPHIQYSSSSMTNSNHNPHSPAVHAGSHNNGNHGSVLYQQSSYSESNSTYSRNPLIQSTQLPPPPPPPPQQQQQYHHQHQHQHPYHHSSPPPPPPHPHSHSSSPYNPRKRPYGHTYNDYEPPPPPPPSHPPPPPPSFSRGPTGRYSYSSYGSKPSMHLSNYSGNSSTPSHVKGYNMAPMTGRGFRHPHSRHHHHHGFHPYPSHHNPYRYHRN